MKKLMLLLGLLMPLSVFAANLQAYVLCPKHITKVKHVKDSFNTYYVAERLDRKFFGISGVALKTFNFNQAVLYQVGRQYNLACIYNKNPYRFSMSLTKFLNYKHCAFANNASQCSGSNPSDCPVICTH